jgi:hypothetical protein
MKEVFSMKKLVIIAFIFLVILALFKCNPLGDNFFVKLTSISPDAKVSHMPSFTLTVSGSNFDSSSLIVFNGTEKETTFVSAAELTCRIDPDDIVLASGKHGPLISGTKQDKTVPVLVRTQLTGEGDSNVLYFTIRENHTFNESIKIYDASWSSTSPQISVDSTGNINVVWTNIVYNPGAPNRTEIYFSRSINDGLNWSQPVNISNPLEHSASPAIAVDSLENNNVVWTDNTQGNYDIYFSRSSDGSETWSQAVNISNSPGVSHRPDIAVDHAGNIDVTWFDETSSIYNIYFSRSTDDGLNWSQPVIISNNLEYTASPDITVDSAGNIYVAWSATSYYGLDIYFSRASVDSLSWSQPVNISHNLNTSVYPAIEVDSAGNPNVVWYDMIGMGKFSKNIVCFSHSADNGTTWSQPVNLSDKMEIHYYADIAVDSVGNINVIWSDDSGDSLYIFYRRSIDNGATWSQVVNVSHDVGAPLYPAMALDSSGNINLVWGDRIPVNEGYDIYFASSIR